MVHALPSLLQAISDDLLLLLTAIISSSLIAICTLPSPQLATTSQETIPLAKSVSILFKFDTICSHNKYRQTEAA